MRAITCLFFAFATVCLGLIAAVPGALILGSIFGTSAGGLEWGGVIMLATAVFALCFLGAAFYFGWSTSDEDG